MVSLTVSSAGRGPHGWVMMTEHLQCPMIEEEKFWSLLWDWAMMPKAIGNCKAKSSLAIEWIFRPFPSVRGAVGL